MDKNEAKQRLRKMMNKEAPLKPVKLEYVDGTSETVMFPDHSQEDHEVEHALSAEDKLEVLGEKMGIDILGMFGSSSKGNDG